MTNDEIFNEVQEYLRKERANTTTMSDEEIVEEGMKKYDRLMSVIEGGGYKKGANFIREFVEADEIQLGKMREYCFSNPALSLSTEDMTYSEGVKSRMIPDEILRMRSEKDINVLMEEALKFINSTKGDKKFYEVVEEIMEKHDLKAPDVYTCAQLSRQTYSKATSPKSQSAPKLSTVWSIIMGLQCDMDEADEVLHSVGFARHGTTFERVMEYFIRNKFYDVLSINYVLKGMGLPLLTSESGGKENDASENL
ncbi:MAG: hypothetical protein LUD29_03290 [Clostridia bacterium]|nr:hypothetical protein [Clostridia bacterium]